MTDKIDSLQTSWMPIHDNIVDVAERSFSKFLGVFWNRKQLCQETNIAYTPVT